ncbi:MAG TPA: PEGA domain-containing protein [Polyangiaceae bacterium]
MRPSLRFRLSVTLFALTLPAALAHAQPESATIAEARQRFSEGVKHFDAGKYELAVAAFRQAYALKAAPEILRNLGAAEIKSGQKKEGARHLAEYLRSATNLPEDERADIEKELTKAERALGRIQVLVAPADAAVSVDGESVGSWVASDPLHVEPGEHGVTVKKTGFETSERTVTTRAGQEQVVEVELTPAKSEVKAAALPPPQVSSAVTALPPDQSESDSRSVVPLIVGGGITALALAGGIGFRIAGSSTEDDAKALDRELGSDGACATSSGSPRCSALHDKFESADQKYNLATVGFVAAGVAAAATAVYYLWPSGKQDGVAVRPVPALASGDARLFLVGGF